ncbi:MAG TPA: sulfotransferase family 2 domain-containing protein [Bryobacteraceae bacterium]|nr:sulfotransferase family 2 domain-containing protein [Bryobacteraceae bacterium]
MCDSRATRRGPVVILWALRFVILHYHILKNAGTTLENVLDRNFGERLARLDTEHRDGRIEQQEILQYLTQHSDVEAISSHQIHYPVPQAPGFLFFDWCFVRDPIDRLRSTYDYFREHPSNGDPLSDAANAMDLRAYVRCLLERFPEQVDNPQTNLLANGAADRETYPEDLERALQRMRETVFLGVVDLYRESVAAGQYRLRAVFPWLNFALPPANVSRGLEGSLRARRAQFREAVGRETYRELVRWNLRDFCLLRAARAEVRRRLSAVKTHDDGTLPPPIAPKISRLPWALRRDEERRRRQGLFDDHFYLRKYSDVRAAGLDPLRHYVEHGAAEGRKPHRLFEPEYYLRQCPDTRAAGVEPLLDFLERGGRAANPHPLFDCEGEAQRLVEYAARAAAIGQGPQVCDEVLDVAAPQQQAFFEAVRTDQLRANGLALNNSE